MRNNTTKFEEIDRWLFEVSEGQASPQVTERINRLLANEAALRAYVVRQLLDESLVHEEFQFAETESIYRGDSILPPTTRRFRPSAKVFGRGGYCLDSLRSISMRTFLAIAATCFVAVSLANIMMGQRRQPIPGLNSIAVDRPHDLDDESAFSVLDTDGVALLTRAVNVEWDADLPSIRVDDRVAARRLRIRSGLLQLEFFSGATIVLEGPAELEIVSSMRCICRYGKLRADVPSQAIGFTIAGGELDVVDLGTEFAMRMEPGGSGEVHVLDGEVSIHRPASGHSRMLKNGDAVRFESAGEMFDLSVDRESFVDTERLTKIEASSRADRYQRWLMHSQRWAGDPSIALYYNFEHQQASDRRLRSAIENAPDSATGAIVGCRWAEGRFDGKGALEFKRTSDRVRVNLEGEFASLSLVAWIRIEGFDQWYSSLLLSDDYGQGNAHWQLTGDGLLKLSIGGDRSYPTGRILKPSDLGRWLQVATVYDSQAKVVRHYVDGKLTAEQEIESLKLLSIGAAEIGNWNPDSQKKNAIRSLNGLLDEIAVFGRALTSDEIYRSFVVGSPNQ